MAAGRVVVAALGLVAVVVAALAGVASAQTGCTRVLIGMAPCLGFIQGNSSTPSSSCCTQLASAVQSDPRCLCQVLNGGAAPLGIALNQTQALALPGACKVPTPPVSQCKAVAGSPAGAPAAAPAPASPATPTTPTAPTPSTPETPSTPSTPSTPAALTPSTPETPSTASSPAADGGSKATPATGGESSSGSSNKMTMSIFFCALFLASYAHTGVF